MNLALFATGDGNTPLSPEEQIELIPDLSTRDELNEWERQNILEAANWAFAPKNIFQKDMLTSAFVCELHRRMFNATWKWAGMFRSSEKNIGIPHHQVRETLAVLLGDTRYWLEHQTYPSNELAIRFHHRLVAIHCFPNGNGRHARLMADVLIQQQGMPVFTWGGTNKNIARPGEIRQQYLDALRSADRNDIQPLLLFART